MSSFDPEVLEVSWSAQDLVAGGKPGQQQLPDLSHLTLLASWGRWPTLDVKMSLEAPGGSVGKESACNAGNHLQETWVQFLGQEEPLWRRNGNSP